MADIWIVVFLVVLVFAPELIMIPCVFVIAAVVSLLEWLWKRKAWVIPASIVCTLVYYWSWL